MFAVVEMSLWPSHSWICFMGTPCFSSRLAQDVYKRQPLHSRLAGGNTIAIVTGSEGGFSPEEAQAAVAAGLVPVGLGPRILRCETAPLAALAVTMALTGNLQ